MALIAPSSINMRKCEFSYGAAAPYFQADSDTPLRRPRSRGRVALALSRMPAVISRLGETVAAGFGFVLARIRALVQFFLAAGKPPAYRGLLGPAGKMTKVA